jgi:hypothetical protein
MTTCACTRLRRSCDDSSDRTDEICRQRMMMSQAQRPRMQRRHKSVMCVSRHDWPLHTMHTTTPTKIDMHVRSHAMVTVKTCCRVMLSPCLWVICWKKIKKLALGPRPARVAHAHPVLTAAVQPAHRSHFVNTGCCSSCAHKLARQFARTATPCGFFTHA